MIKKIKFDNWYVVGMKDKTLSGELAFDNNKLLIIGDNGLGKTSFLNTIFGILFNDSSFYNYVRFDEFSIEFKNGDILKMNNSDYIKNFNILEELLGKDDQSLKEYWKLKTHFKEECDKYSVNFEEETSELGEKIQKWLRNDSLMSEISYEDEYSTIDGKSVSFRNTVDSTLRSLFSKINSENIKYAAMGAEQQRQNNDILNGFNKKEVVYLSSFRNAKDYFSNYTSNINQNNRNLINYEFNKKGIQKNIEEIISNLRTMAIDLKTDFFESILEKSSSGNISDDEIIVLKEIGGLLSEKSFTKFANEMETNTKFKDVVGPSFSKVVKNFNGVPKKQLEMIKQWITTTNLFLNGKKLMMNSKGIFIKTKNDTHEFNSSDFSAGEKNIMNLLKDIIITKPKLLIIDEPEISLSIKWQSLLSKVICKSKDINFIITTHSPFFINDEDAGNLNRIDSWQPKK